MEDERDGGNDIGEVDGEEKFTKAPINEAKRRDRVGEDDREGKG